MTDETPRCEPPPELRDRDGWHWVRQAEFPPTLARWHPSENPDTEPLWTSTGHVYSGTPRYAAREWGYRYLAPATPPAVVAALVEALEGLTTQAYVMGQHLVYNAPTRDLSAALDAARAALAAYKEAGR